MAGLSSIIFTLFKPEELPIEVHAPEQALLHTTKKSVDTQECPRNESLWRR